MSTLNLETNIPHADNSEGEPKQSDSSTPIGSNPKGKFASANPFEAFLLAEEQDGQMEIDSQELSTQATPPAQPSNFPDVLQLLEAAKFTTSLLLISFLPDWIHPEHFCSLMDSILRLFYSEEQLGRQKIAAHHKPEFSGFFGMKPPLWMIMHFSKEQHGSYLLKLPSELTFGAMGSLGGLILPRILTAPVPPSRKRQCVIQAVPPDFRATFLLRPELAFWRGIGPNPSSGLGSLALTLVEHRVDMSIKKLIMEGELPDDVRHFSYLSLRYVNIQAPGQDKRAKKHEKGTLPGTGPKDSWQESFIVTQCTAALGRQELCFRSFLSGGAPKNTLMSAVNLYGWRGEIASEFVLFSTWEFTPDSSLLGNQPASIFPGIKGGYQVRELCAMLVAEGQTLEGILYAYIERGPHDKLILATDGRKFIATPALLAISSERAYSDTDLPGMGPQRLHYLSFRQLTRMPTSKLSGLLTVAQRKKAQLSAVVPGQSYALAAKQPPAHPDQLVKNYLRQEVTTLLHDARNEIKQDVRDLQAQLEKANSKIAELETAADKATKSADQALKAGQGAVKLIGTHYRDAQEQHNKDMEFFRLLYDTMKESGMDLPPEAAAYLKIGNKRRSPSDPEVPTMDTSHG